jgi:hypothetical protein
MPLADGTDSGQLLSVSAKSGRGSSARRTVRIGALTTATSA